MKGYVKKTDGSFYVKKETTIIWNYKNCDLDLGRQQATQLKAQLVDIFEHLPVLVIENDVSIEVILKEIK